MMEAAGELGITLIASAALLQGQVAQNLPAFVADALGLENDVERALQFARSSPGIATALVGMSRVAHVEANTRLVGWRRRESRSSISCLRREKGCKRRIRSGRVRDGGGRAKW